MSAKDDIVSIFVGHNDICLTSHPLPPSFLPAFVVFSPLNLSFLKEKIDTHMCDTLKVRN